MIIFNKLLSSSTITTVLAEKTWLSRFTEIPPAKTLEVVHFLTINGDSNPEVSINGPVTMENISTNTFKIPNVNSNDLNGVEISIVSH